MKRKGIDRKSTLVAILIVCAGGVNAAQDEGSRTAVELLSDAFENLYGHDYLQTVDLTVYAPGSRPITKELQIIRRQTSRPGKTLIRFLNPYDVRRTSVLVLQNTGALDDLFVYFPALKRIRRISSAQRADSFFGTDLRFEDIEPKTADDYLVSEVSHESGGKNCVGLQIVSLEHRSSTYERMVLCVNRSNNLIHGVDYYQKGKLVKQLDVDPASARLIGESYIPFLMTMRTLRTESETRIVTRDYRIIESIPESVFSTRNLESGDADGDRARILGGE